MKPETMPKFFRIIFIVLLLMPGFALAADLEEAPRAVPAKEGGERIPDIKKPEPPLLETAVTANTHVFSPQAPKISASQNQEPFAEIKILLPAEKNERKIILEALAGLGNKELQESATSEVILELSADQEKKLYQSGIKYKVIRYGIKISGRVSPIDAPK